MEPLDQMPPVQGFCVSAPLHQPLAVPPYPKAFWSIWPTIP